MKLASFKDAVGFCTTTPFWTDKACIGFFILGMSLGTVVGMSILHILR